MLLTDVNVLVYAHREDAVDHPSYRDWLQGLLASDSAYAVSELVLSAFVRIVTHPRIFRPPTPLERALAFAGEVRDRPNAVLTPGPRHWRSSSATAASVTSGAAWSRTPTSPPSPWSRDANG